jgi:osmotically-inducible protein OsmY
MLRIRRILTWAIALASPGVLLLLAGTVLASEKRMPAATLTDYLQNRLAKEESTLGNNIQVMVRNDTLLVDGTVPTLYGLQRANSIVTHASDDYPVRSLLRVASSTIPDNALADSVTVRIHTYAFYTMFDWIVVSANDSKVTISGQAVNSWHKRQYLHEAQRVRGVAALIDSVEVLPTSMTDDELRYQVATLLYDEPRFYPYAHSPNPPIHIIVRNGVVTLEGTVGTDYEHDLASSIVLDRSSAFRVMNNLRVRGGTPM